MARIKLQAPERFPFRTELAVRISDINYGGHLGNDAVLSMMHEARMRFLQAMGFNEMDAGGASIIMADTAIVYRAESFYGDRLGVEVAAVDFNNFGCDLFYRFRNNANQKEVALAKTGIVFFDYEQRKIQAIPQRFVEACRTLESRSV